MKRLCLLGFCLTLVASAADVTIKFMPSEYQGHSFHLAEGTPTVMLFKALNGTDKAPETGVLYLELPEHILFQGAACLWNRSPQDRLVQDSFTSTPVTRDGKPYIRHEITLSQAFRISTVRSWSWEYDNIYLTAQPGSTGKTAAMYARAVFDGRASKETRIQLTVIPTLRKPLVQTSRFALGLCLLPGYYGAPEAIRENFVERWRGLTATPVGVHVDQAFHDSMRIAPGFKPIWAIATDVNMPTFRYIGYRQTIGDFPKTDLCPRGKTSPAPSWIAQDADGKVAAYVRQAMELYRKNMPNTRAAFWNIEPVMTDFGQYDLQEFARKMKLDSVPTAESVGRLYTDAWHQFRLRTTCDIIRNVTSAMKEAMPDLEVQICGIPLSRRYPNNVNPFGAMDPRIHDEYPSVDAHLPMQYYSGTALFDDVEYSASTLKKPLYGLQDLTENNPSFYSLYNTDIIRQNIVLYALHKTAGYTVYPLDHFDHRYIQSIYDSYGIAALGEPYWRDGVDITAQCQAPIVSEMPIRYQTADGTVKQSLLNSSAKFIRWRVHRLKDECAAVFFNFDATRNVFLRLKVPAIPADMPLAIAPSTDFRKDGKTTTAAALADGMLLKLKPQSVMLLLAGRNLPTATDHQELADWETELSELQDTLNSTTARRYTATAKDRHAFDWELLNGNIRCRLSANDKSVWSDEAKAHAVSWQWTASNSGRTISDFLANGGRVGEMQLLTDQGNRALPDFRLASSHADAQGYSAVFEAEVPPFKGAERWIEPLEELHTTVAWQLSPSGTKLRQTVTFENRSPRQATMTFALRVKNYLDFNPSLLLVPTADGTMRVADKGNFMADRKRGALPLAVACEKTFPWDGGIIELIENGKNTRHFLCQPDSSSAGCFSWSTYDHSCGRTAEPFTAMVALPSGGKRTCSFQYSCAMRTGNNLLDESRKIPLLNVPLTSPQDFRIVFDPKTGMDATHTIQDGKLTLDVRHAANQPNHQRLWALMTCTQKLQAGVTYYSQVTVKCNKTVPADIWFAQGAAPWGYFTRQQQTLQKDDEQTYTLLFTPAEDYEKPIRPLLLMLGNAEAGTRFEITQPTFGRLK